MHKTLFVAHIDIMDHIPERALLQLGLQLITSPDERSVTKLPPDTLYLCLPLIRLNSSTRVEWRRRGNKEFKVGTRGLFKSK